ncbi:hypothetical protein A2X44_00320 [candidate division CPR3 bacterium GWF2_35_18]|uniref:Uncharacterized protein n=1 Tax=candidate division CPR3 bacterium GW2011_GWF2_35_18 TaxID=1618350 RepID=A0A0G0BKY2_UNCC3|nr:MAG: hypothetical protein UR67_C0001G0048 [candidate division CPR3 bacterium GW2011_GWF2_35_18]OGB63358.1 MAG: hypothetical protein A2X44_00320 [candidate division CPR3 bacterium GWF2_35_18]OGB65574.1 MAG: hypothetical protein A2250_02195 [candidate division CPR3 bacterium RIFOXYA2_FULL_35_13]
MKKTKLVLRLSGVVLLSTLLTGCSAAGELIDQVETFVNGVIDFENKAWINVSSIQQIFDSNPVLVWGMLAIGLGLFLIFCLNVIVSAVKRENVPEAIAKRHWFWLEMMFVLPAPFVTYTMADEIGKLLWQVFGIGPDLARRAMGFTVDWLSLNTSVDFMSFVGIPLTYGYLAGHLAYEILLAIAPIILIPMAIFRKSLKPIMAWFTAFGLFLLMDLSWGLMMQLLAANMNQPGSTYAFLMGALLIFPIIAGLTVIKSMLPEDEDGHDHSWWDDKAETLWEGFQTWILSRHKDKDPDIKVSNPNAPAPKPGQRQLPTGQTNGGGNGGHGGNGKTPSPSTSESEIVEGEFRPVNDGSDGKPIITPAPTTGIPTDGDDSQTGKETLPNADPNVLPENTPAPEERYFASEDIVGPDGTVYARAGSQVYPEISGDDVSVNGVPTKVEQRNVNGELLGEIGYIAGATAATALGAPEAAPIAGSIAEEAVVHYVETHTSGEES